MKKNVVPTETPKATFVFWCIALQSVRPWSALFELPFIIVYIYELVLFVWYRC